MTKPYKINIAQTVLDDLHNRLGNTRWPDAPANAGWNFGTDPVFLKELVDYWRKEYDWRKAEAKLNELDQFTADVDGTELHFVHAKSKKEDAPVVLLIHGWPDSFYRFSKVIPELTKDFHVVVPSLPGFGFSEKKPMSSKPTAELLVTLMTKILGYQKFMAAGGDIATNIIKSMALNHADVLTAIHLTDASFPNGSEDFASMSPDEQKFAGACQQWFYTEGAYTMEQSTKPLTLAYGLTDSPVGLAAWIVEKFHAWSGGNEKAFTKDELLTNVMIYWVTGTIESSVHTYLENARAEFMQGGSKPPKRSEVPAAITIYPGETVHPPREWAERSVNVQRFTEMNKGGHFAALEVPELYAKDVSGFFKAQA